MRKLLLASELRALLVGVAWAAEPLSDPQMDPGTLVLQNGSVFET
jgi:hypothetical protein